jgi:hypothetical protein
LLYSELVWIDKSAKNDNISDMEGRLGRLFGKIRGDKTSDSPQRLGEIDSEELLLREGTVEQLTREVELFWRFLEQPKILKLERWKK